MLAPVLLRCIRLVTLIVASVSFGAARAAPDLATAVRLYDQRELAAAAAAFTHLAATGAPRCNYFLGKIAIRQHRYADAVGLLERAAVAAAADDDVWHWLGNAHAWVAATSDSLPTRLQHARRSLAAYLRAVDLNPESIPARLSLINLQRHLPALFGGGLHRARAQAEEIARRDARQGAYARALLLAHEQNYREALALLAPLQQAFPDYYSAHLLVGYIATRSGLAREEARAALNRCLALVPGEFEEPHETARELLALLDGAAAPQRPAAAGKNDEQVTAR